MCGSEVERKKDNRSSIQQHCYYWCAYVTYNLQCGRDRRCVVVKLRGRKTTGVQFNNTAIIGVHMLLTIYSVAETDDVW